MKMNFSNLNSNNHLLYAIKNYDNPQCISVNDFMYDFRKISYIKKILKYYEETDDIESKIILLLNHIISFKNVFGEEATIRLFFLLLDKKYYKYIKPFFIFLNIKPDVIYGINGENIYFNDIFMDDKIIKELRKRK